MWWVSHPGPGSTTSRAHPTTVARYCPLWAPNMPSQTSQWVTHHGIALVCYSLNFGVPMEPEANELPKGLMLGKDVNIHIRITPLCNVGSYSGSIAFAFLPIILCNVNVPSNYNR
ncbi:hypothetical protein DVH24_030453 [Malus domestica]|uniref:Uncharacterized protein n=1 Tax=Malus domestica TaxID=3750 RepID=A0A498K2J1_MALDO|nr:hypothetical protein DVH24_030453 [Malus domestica]